MPSTAAYTMTEKQNYFFLIKLSRTLPSFLIFWGGPQKRLVNAGQLGTDKCSGKFTIFLLDENWTF